MATRSNIAQLLPDDRVQVIYCHFDGYMSGVGRTLTKHYKTTDRVAELIALATLLCLTNTCTRLAYTVMVPANHA